MKQYNIAHCTGKVQYIRFNTAEDSLTLVLSLFEPKWGGDRNSDYPNVYIEGEMAKKVRNQIHKGDFVTVIGHVEEREIMTNIGNSLFRRTVGPVLIPDEDMVFIDKGHSNVNSFFAAGTVTKVQEKPDEGKRFYMIYLNTPINGKDVMLRVVHFDHDMALKPEAGDYVVVSGTLRTKNNRDANNNPYKLCSIVAKSISVVKLQKEP